MTRLDAHLPVFDVQEVHERRIAAPPEAVWAALTAITLGDLTLTRALVRVRQLGVDPDRPDLPLFEAGPVAVLHVEPGAYAVGGAVAQPWRLHPPRHPIASLRDLEAFAEPGWAKYLTDWELLPDRRGTLLRTTTRVVCTDRWSRRAFRCYWLLIRAGSGLIRRDILRSTARAATRQPKEENR